MNQTEQIQKQLFEAALKARENAHAPYSHFTVGASVYTASGKIFSAANVENASYGLSVCAERIAIFKAVTEGHQKLSAMAVVADGLDPVRPCGACRQVMAEFNPQLIVIRGNLKGELIVQRLDDLYPDPFIMIPPPPAV